MIKKFKKIAAFISAAVMMTATFLYFPIDTFKGINWGISANAGDTISPIEPNAGDGTEENPYEIGIAEQLYWFAEQVNSGNTKINAVLVNDITVNENLLSSLEVDSDGNVSNGSNFTAWTPIGTDNSYNGKFDGQKYKISGLYFNYRDNNDNRNIVSVGLFGTMNKGTVSNVCVADSYFKGSMLTGGVCGDSGGTVENCYNTGTISSDNVGGGVCGYSRGTVENCYNTGTISSDKSGGGVCGYSEGTVENCYNTGTVSGGYAGGVCGTNNYGTIDNSYNTGTVSGGYAGGVCSDNVGTIKSSYNTGTVSGSDEAGGVCGHNGNGTITNCYYLDTSETDNLDGTTFKTAAQFASGEVAMLLGDAFGQTIGTDEIPVLGGQKVYKVEKTGCGIETSEEAYSNTNENIVVEHSFENGICTKCGTKDEAKQNSNGTYEISNAGQLYWFAGLVNGTLDGVKQNTSANAILTANITVNENLLDSLQYDAEDNVSNGSDFITWTPIADWMGNRTTQYSGTFDGNNKTVSGLYFNGDSTCIGLFGSSESDGNIKNVGVVDSYFKGNDHVGGVCGNNAGTITNCYNAGNLTAIESSATIGGICGYNNGGTVTNCYNTGTVTATGSVASVGGVCGCSIAPISNCYNTGTVTATSSGADISGICGYNFGPVTNCYYLADTEDENGGKTAAQFASGEVAYLLSQGCTVGGGEGENAVTYSGSVWGQNLATDEIPVLGGQKVYKVEKTGCGIETSEKVYSNTNENIVVEHSFENGICTKCGTKEKAKQNSNGTYEISNAGQLYWFAEQVNSGEEYLNAVLTADIVVNEGDLSGYDGISKNSWRKWTPIRHYSGTFDGQNHKISGLYFNDYEAFVGLFGITEGATIKKVGVVNSYFEGSENVGGICGVGFKGTISECYNTATIIGNVYRVGGICGNCDNLNVINCFNSGKISSKDEFGGICGNIYNSSIKNCYYDKTVFTGDAIGETLETNTVEKVEGKTTEQFASGEVAFLLGDSFGQTIETDKIPVLGGQKVYNVKKYSDCGKTTEIGSVYSNSSEDVVPAHDYSNGGICNVCNGLKNGKDGFKSASVSLTDGVIVNYNVVVSGEVIKDKNAYINFKSESGINKNIKFSEASKTGETYKFSLELRPDQMSETITAQVIYGDGTNGSSVDFSIKEYSEKLPNEKDKKLADSMKLYGAFAQAYTGRKTDNLVSDIKDYETNATIGEEYNYSLAENASGIKAKSATLQIGSQVTIVVKYQLEEGKNISNYDFMCGDKSLEPVKNGDYYYVYLKNILPQDLDKMYEFVVKDKSNAENETTLKYSAFSYMKSAFEKANSDKKLTNLLNAMYDYNKAAEEHTKG